MEIKILMTKNCASCNSFFETARQALNELNPKENIIRVDDLMEILPYHILKLPALVIDGKVVHSGKKLSPTEMKDLLSNHINTAE